MEIRKAVIDDLDTIMDIYAYARSFMAENGNPTQWGQNKPSKDQINQDIEMGKCFVCIEGDTIQNVFYFALEEDPTYAVIDGKWLDDTAYAVVHRVASAKGSKGAASFSLNWAFRQWPNIRMDTHDDNIPMQNLLKKLGFAYCGRIQLEDGSPRIAFQRIYSSTPSAYLLRDARQLC